MFDAGLVDETRGLVDLGLREGRTASRAVGYAQALAVIDGTATLEDAVADTALRTRRLVRRQESWFGADPRVGWFDPLGRGPWRRTSSTGCVEHVTHNGAHG